MTTLFAYEVSPGTNPDRLYFATSPDECRSEASLQRSELREEPESGPLQPMRIFEVKLKLPDLPTLLQALNNDDLTKAIITERKIVETLED